MTPEAKLKLDCKRIAESRGCKMYVTSWKGRKGFPDRALLCPAQAFALVEFKAPNGLLSPHQISTIIDLRMAGLEVWVVKSVDEFTERLEVALERPIRLS